MTQEEAKAEESERERLHKEQEERARRYGIAPKDGGHLTPPAGYPDDPDEYGDPVNYRYPIDAEHIRAAIVYFNQTEHRTQGGYTAEEWAIIGKRIASAASKLLDAEYEYRDGKVVRREAKTARILKSDEAILRIGGWGVVFGDTDLEGDEFTPETDFWLDKLPGPRPVLYEHALREPGLEVLGRTVKMEKRADGLWLEAELDRHNAYVRLIEELIRRGALGWSSGAVAHLVRRRQEENKSIIESWPIAEFSLTPTPAEPRTLGVQELHPLADACPELKSFFGEEKQIKSDKEEITMDESKIAEIVEEAVSHALEMKSVGVVVANETTESAVKGFDIWLRTGRKSSELKAALAEGAGNTGGYVVPPEYHRELVAALAEQSILRQAGARVIRVSTNQVYVARLDYGTAATIVSEAGSYPEAEPTFAQEAVTLYKFGRLAKASEELLADAMVDIWRDVLQPDFAQAFAAAENTYFTTGTGSGQPEGILTGGTLGKTAASATAITADEVIDLYYSLPHLYRQNAVWMMHDSTAKALRKLKDSTNQYLWQPGLQAGAPDTLLGRPVITNNAMPEIAASAKVIAFGDFRYFWIFESGDLTVQRLNELYAAAGQVGFRAFRRLGSVVMLPAAIVYLQMA